MLNSVNIGVFKDAQFKSGICFDIQITALCFDLTSVRGKLIPANSGG